jgi:SAM-dependent methyltransferase
MRRSDEEAIRRYYDDNPEREWIRTQKSLYSSIEFELIQRAIAKNSRGEGLHMLELGCGPGRHALALARRGHFVSLVDQSEACVSFARQKFRECKLEDKLVSANVAPVQQWEPPKTELYDAVLIFGPLYHLLTAVDRERCLEVGTRRMRLDGTVYCTFITLFSVLKDLLKRGRVADIRALLKGGYLSHGIYRPVSEESRQDYMPPLWSCTKEEACKLYRTCGLSSVTAIACEGFAAFMRPYVEEAVRGEHAFSELIETLWDTCEHPSLIDNSDHLLLIGRRT